MYPADHWTYSAQMNVQNFEDTVKQHVDAGKTFFVRYIIPAFYYCIFDIATNVNVLVGLPAPDEGDD